MVHYAYDGGVPIVAFAIIENAVAAHQEKIRIASGKGGRDAHFFRAALADAVAIGEVKAAHGCKLRMLGDILDAHAQVATAAVQVQRSQLEYRLVPSRVKTAERDEVIHQLVQVAAVAQQPFHREGCLYFGFHRFVQSDQLVDRFAMIAGGNLGAASRHARLPRRSRRAWRIAMPRTPRTGR